MQQTISWLRGLLSVGISAAASGVTVVIVDPHTFNIHEGLGKLGEVCLVMALTHMAMYLQKSPLPDVLEKSQQSQEANS